MADHVGKIASGRFYGLAHAGVSQGGNLEFGQSDFNLAIYYGYGRRRGTLNIKRRGIR